MKAEITDRLHDRLRWPTVAATVAGSLPILFFGDPSRARVATVGLNPSYQEYLSRGGVELDGPRRRFETLRSLGAADRGSLTRQQAGRAIERMRAYFDPAKPVYAWFRPLARVMDGFGTPFADGTAVHLDLVQEATDPVWSGMQREDRGVADQLLERDLNFLKWQIEAFSLRTLICTSATVMKHTMRMLDARVLEEGSVALIRWSIASGKVAGDEVLVAGWNIPLARPTGLDAEGQRKLGMLLRDRVAALQPG